MRGEASRGNSVFDSLWDGEAVDISEKILAMSERNTACERVPFWEKCGLAEVPPSPYPSERLDWRGFRKNGLQNLEPQRLRGQNLDNKRLTDFFAVAACAASALTMICLFVARVKVGCHKSLARAVEFSNALRLDFARHQRELFSFGSRTFIVAVRIVSVMAFHEKAGRSQYNSSLAS